MVTKYGFVRAAGQFAVKNPYAIFLSAKSYGPIAQLVEQLTLNQRVAGSSPARLTIISNDLRQVEQPAVFHL